MSDTDENKGGIRDMASPRRYGIERVAYWLMRLSGLGLLAYFVGHIYETSAILRGRAGWDELLAMTQSTEGHALLALVIGMCVFHTANGIRLMLVQGGVWAGKPGRADYPYTPRSQNARNKIAIYSSIVMAAVAMVYGLTVMFGE